jgi:hypothetical protein
VPTTEEDAVPKPIVIEAEEAQKIGVTLVGEKYTITPPKAALAMKWATEAGELENDPGAVMAVLSQWIMAAFGKTNGRKVIARLNDPDDQLDIVHVSKLMEAAIEQQTGNPTS